MIIRLLDPCLYVAESSQPQRHYPPDVKRGGGDRDRGNAEGVRRGPRRLIIRVQTPDCCCPVAPILSLLSFAPSDSLMSTVEATFPDDGEASAVEGLLLEFRENPPGPGDKTLSKSLSRCHTLINSLKYSGKRKHWFCERATPLAIEVSTFLLRLHAYKGGGDWRAQLADVLRGCSDCVAGYLAARLRSDDS